MFSPVHRIFVATFMTFGIVSGAKGQDTQTGTFALSGGMGITAIGATDVVDYINTVTTPSKRLDDFSSAGEFFGSLHVRFDNSWGGKLEYAYLVNSYNVPGILGSYEYWYAIHMPTLIAQVIDQHAAYAFKFGVGLGYHIATLSERWQGAAERSFTSSGLGIKLDAEGNTVLDQDLFVYLGADVRVNFMSAFKDAQGNRLQTSGGEPKNVKMSFLGLGLKFGMIYYF